MLKLADDAIATPDRYSTDLKLLMFAIVVNDDMVELRVLMIL
jgi:hypothetical protein